MAQPLLTSRRAVLLIAGMLLINSLVLPVSVARLPAAVLRPVIDTLLKPARDPLYGMALRLRAPEPESIPQEIDHAQLLDDYAMLRVENERLTQQLQEARRQLSVVSLIRNMAQDRDIRPVTVRVNGFTDTGTQPILTLAGGSRMGIDAGMSVCWETTVVGRVVEPVGPFSADVELITAHDASLQVRFKSPPGQTPPRAFTRRVSAGPDYLSFVAEVERDLDVRVGDLVVLADELQYTDARGMLVGRITRITEYTPDPYLLKRVIIRPDIDLRRLPEVAVLIPEPE